MRLYRVMDRCYLVAAGLSSRTAADQALIAALAALPGHGNPLQIESYDDDDDDDESECV